MINNTIFDNFFVEQHKFDYFQPSDNKDNIDHKVDNTSTCWI
jgi:hypothetical protein